MRNRTCSADSFPDHSCELGRSGEANYLSQQNGELSRNGVRSEATKPAFSYLSKDQCSRCAATPSGGRSLRTQSTIALRSERVHQRSDEMQTALSAPDQALM